MPGGTSRFATSSSVSIKVIVPSGSWPMVPTTSGWPLWPISRMCRPLFRYGLNPWYGFALPVSAALYVLMTVDSARRHWADRSGEWKGRTHAR